MIDEEFYTLVGPAENRDPDGVYALLWDVSANPEFPDVFEEDNVQGIVFDSREDAVLVLSWLLEQAKVEGD